MGLLKGGKFTWIDDPYQIENNKRGKLKTP